MWRVVVAVGERQVAIFCESPLLAPPPKPGFLWGRNQVGWAANCSLVTSPALMDTASLVSRVIKTYLLSFSDYEIKILFLIYNIKFFPTHRSIFIDNIREKNKK